ncbi:DNA primase [Paraburkholderia sediminicola]|uniref:LPD7 domain-containing protein n=1 Tax=Paraburkholderia sediminicola TaxID=458836 RepID=UPI0038B78248
MTETSLSAEPVINVIEQDIRGLPGAVEQSGSAGRTQQLDAAAMDAVSARRRREFDAARSRLHDQVARDNVELIRQPDASPGTNTPSKGNVTARAPLDQPPERVRKRYLRTGNQYFLKDAPYQLAFEDLGPYLVTEHNRPDVVESMVDMASAKSWTSVRVSGHEAFRSEVWLQGTLLGIEVRGYEPKAADLARLADARQALPKNRMEVDASMPLAGTESPSADNSTSAKASATQAETPGDKSGTARPVSARSEQQPRPYRAELQMISDEPETPRQYAGELREHGRAPYLHNPARSDSYYVAFGDARGTERVVWGVDLERTMLVSRAEPRDHVTLENLGRRIVPVKVPILDDNGTVVGEKEKDVYRNTWQVDVVQRERSTAESCGHPERSSGTAAPANAPTHEGRQAHRRSTVSDEDKVLHLAVLVGAMREQGFSARSIARVQQRAEEMLDAFGLEGIPVPRPRVFDPKAPSERDRRARPAAGRAPVREVEREIERALTEPSPAR